MRTRLGSGRKKGVKNESNVGYQRMIIEKKVRPFIILAEPPLNLGAFVSVLADTRSASRDQVVARVAGSDGGGGEVVDWHVVAFRSRENVY